MAKYTGAWVEVGLILVYIDPVVSEVVRVLRLTVNTFQAPKPKYGKTLGRGMGHILILDSAEKPQCASATLRT